MPPSKGKGSGGSAPEVNPCSGCTCGPILVILLALATWFAL